MNSIKLGMVCVIVGCAAAAACGGSSSNDSGNSGAGTGAGGSSAGAPSSSAGGSSVPSAGSTSTGTAGGDSTGGVTSTGGASNVAGTSAGGCSGMIPPALAAACPAAATCAQKNCKAQIAACDTQSIETRVFLSCTKEVTACGMGAGGGSGEAGAAGTGKTCADLATCCGTLAAGQQKQICTALAGNKNDTYCDAAYATFCG